MKTVLWPATASLPTQRSCSEEMKENEKNTLGYTPGEYVLFRKYARRFLILFALLYMTIYCCRLNLGNAAAVMMEEEGWTSADIGLLTSVLFWTYGIGQMVNGRLADLFGARRFIVMAVCLSAACNVLLSFQKSIAVIAVIWAFNGFFQSMAWPPGLAIMSGWWPSGKRGFASGFMQAFSGFGQACATLAVALSLKLLPGMGWRGCFILPAAIPVVMLVIYKLFTKNSPADIGLKPYAECNVRTAETEAEMAALIEKNGALYPYRYVLSIKAFRAWLVIAMIGGLARYGLTTWIPLYFTQRFGVDVTAGLLQSLALPVGMGFGTFFVPVLTDRFCSGDRRPAVVISAIVAAVSVISFMTLDPRTAGGSVLVSIMLFIAGFAIYAISGVSFAYACDLGGRVFTATCSGIIGFVAYSGAALQSMIYGFILEKAGWNTVFISIAALCFVSAFIARRKNHGTAE